MAAPELNRVLARNIQSVLKARHQFDRSRTRQQRAADAITGFTGSMSFVYIHAVLFGGWIIVNRGGFGIRPWDPFPYVMLAMIASVEAIFLSTFVLISQNRMAMMAERRAELDLQINLLAEHEVTKLIVAVDAIATKLGIDETTRSQLAPLQQDVTPDSVLREMDHNVDSAVVHPEEAAKVR